MEKHTCFFQKGRILSGKRVHASVSEGVCFSGQAGGEKRRICEYYRYICTGLKQQDDEHGKIKGSYINSDRKHIVRHQYAHLQIPVALPCTA